MTPEEQAEAYARIVYYLPWVTEAKFDSRDQQPLQLWLAQRPVRLYLLLSRFCPDILLPMLETVWPAVAKGVLEDATLNVLDARDAPKVFGREAFERKARNTRLRMASTLHDMVISLWRTGGKYIVDGGNDFSGMVEPLRDALVQAEAGIIVLVEQAVRAPHHSDDQIVLAARDELLQRSLANPVVMKAHTRAQIAGWIEATIKPAQVPEARRRAAASGIGQIVSVAEKEWRAKGMTRDEMIIERAQMVDTFLNHSKS